MKTLKTMMALALFLCCTANACSQQIYNSGGNPLSKRIKGSKNYVTKEIKVEDFTKINVTGSPDITYTQQSGKPKVEIYTSDNLVELFDIYVKGNTLYVGFKKGVNFSYDKMEVRVFSPKLNAVSISGSSDLLLKNGVNTDNLALSITGSGDIEGSDLRCDNLTVSVSGSGDIDLKKVNTNYTQVSIAGSGDITLSGVTEEAKYSVAGSGDISSDNLVAKRVSANIAGSGDIRCHATEHLKASVSGSGSIGYKGNPELDAPRKVVYKL